MRFFLSTIIFLCFGSLLLAQKPKDQNAVISELTASIAKVSFTKKPVRLAVVTFVSTQPETKSSYGDYLTESIIGKLAEQNPAFKVFERKRLDAILKENELMLSGLMKPSEALKIGELLPIDALFSGTYTKLKSYIDISGRLIDVTNGEILMSYSGRVKLSKNLKTLFPVETSTSAEIRHDTVVVRENNIQQQTNPKETVVDKKSACKEKTERFAGKLHDLSTTQKVNEIVAEAMKTPFEESCGQLHYHLINSLSRYGIMHESYKQFLLATLDTISFPSGDERAYSIFSYITKDSTADDAEWRSGFGAIRKVGNYTLSTYLGFMFSKVNQPSIEILQNRVDQYFDRLIVNEIGLPRAVSFNQGFFEMMEGINSNHSLRLYVYDKYHERVATEPDNVVGSHLMYLRRMYEDENDPATKTKVMTWIAEYFNNHVNKKSPEQLYEWSMHFEMEPNEEKNHYKTVRNQERLTKYPVSDLEVLVNKCVDKFSKYATETQYSSQRDDRIAFCVRHSIPVPGVIPSIAEAESVLKGSDIDEQLRVMKLLVLMETSQVKPIEKTLVALLKRKSLERKEDLFEVQSMAIQLLGRMRTESEEAIAKMITNLTSFNYRESEAAEEALVTIGKPAVKNVVSALSKTTSQDGGLQYKLVMILGKIGKDAKPAVPVIKQLLSKTTNADIRYAIEAALDQIE